MSTFAPITAVRCIAPVASSRRTPARGSPARALGAQRRQPVRQQSLSSSRVSSRRRSLTKVAAEEEGSAPKADPPPAPDSVDAKLGLKEGQLTAIVTGGISLVLGVAYLALVNAIGSRELLPPPPEALGL